MPRIDKRSNNQIRPCVFKTNFLINAAGSVLVEQGNTRVLCAVSINYGVPRWMKEQNVSGGWLTGEYQLLPASTGTRTQREISRGKIDGRTQEIQRLIGRSLRSVVDLKKLGENTVYVDCDVIDADGGTRCASINGAVVALILAFRKMQKEGKLTSMPIKEHIGAISAGIVNNTPLLDLCYKEDSSAAVDMNVVMTESGRFVEVQGSGEESTFDQDEFTQLMALTKKGISEVITLQKEALQS